MHDTLTSIQGAYDRIATAYDAQWSVHVAEPQRRLTRDLRLARGESCVDLGCGTGVDTLEMLREVAPGRVLAVDCSNGMLDSARGRAREAGFVLETRCQSADDFIRESEAASFDVISLRFCLGYLDWRAALPRLPSLLRRGGRIGILTILGNSAPQAYAVYREMAAALGVSEVALTALASVEQIEALLQRGGGSVHSAWTHSFRLLFRTGIELARFMVASGIATDPALSALPPELADALWAEFAARVETFREPEGVPLDFHLAGVTAS